MAKSSAEVLVVGDREVKISSPDRIIYEPTDSTPAVTKLDVCKYFALVGEPLMRAIGDRPVAMERWPDGWREGMSLATGNPGGGGRWLLSKAPAAGRSVVAGDHPSGHAEWSTHR
jgi:hypothetical protein